MPTTVAKDPRALALEIKAAQELREQIKLLVGEDDEQAVQDTFDGETTLDATIRTAVLGIMKDEADATSLKTLADNHSSRKARLDKRVAAVRGLIAQAMVVAGWKKLPLDVATLSITTLAPKVEIDPDREQLIPAQFWKRADPTVSKTELKKALTDAHAVLDEALRIANPEERSMALFNILEGFPTDPERNAALVEARVTNDPERQAEMLEAIAKRFSPIPGAALVEGGVTLMARTK